MCSAAFVAEIWQVYAAAIIRRRAAYRRLPEEGRRSKKWPKGFLGRILLPARRKSA